MDNTMNIEGMNFENNEIAEEIVEACENAEVSGGGIAGKVILGLVLTAGVVAVAKRKQIKEFMTKQRIKKLEKLGYIVAHESEMMDCEAETSGDNDVEEEAENY